ncbi:unnamed protein product [Lactuca saligna]|uniref:Uncharacterized protein n=1 Tax=Lactuca saligna TaxID=75948 RepID=A0AA35YYN9_LACSI|nr:unnamed protein product [Lactuca saligna]
MWHIHKYEVKSDVLFLPGVPGPVERQDREKAPKTYGKTIHVFGRKGITECIWKAYPKEFTQKHTLMVLDSKLLYEISICIAWRPGKVGLSNSFAPTPS